jgi:hypothetical protein
MGIPPNVIADSKERGQNSRMIPVSHRSEATLVV